MLALFLLGCGGGSTGTPGGGLNSGGGGSGNGGGGGGTITPSGQACNVISLGAGANLNGFKPFAGDNPWNQDISSAAVDPNSSDIINFIGGTTGLHPDFGTGTNGIPYVVVSG